jgi:hypothetical protein
MGQAPWTCTRVDSSGVQGGFSGSRRVA